MREKRHLPKFPRIQKQKDGYFIKAHILPCNRAHLVFSCLVLRMEKLKKWAVIFLLIDFVIEFIGWRPLLEYLPVSRTMLIVGICSWMLIYLAELRTRLFLFRKIFGQCLQVKINEEGMTVRLGFKKAFFPLHENPMMRARKIEDTTISAFKDGRLIEVIAEGLYRKPLIECYDIKMVDQIVTVVSHLLRTANLEMEYEIDPRTRKFTQAF